MKYDIAIHTFEAYNSSGNIKVPKVEFSIVGRGTIEEMRDIAKLLVPHRDFYFRIDYKLLI